jgi:CO/xanthine dehydrogenase Mo-binding subunit
MHAQIVADALGIPFEAVDIHEVDTAEVPDSGPTVASRTCMIVGGLLERCARRMRRTIGRLTPAAYYRRHGGFSVTERYAPPPGLSWDDAQYRGDAYGSFSYACNVVELAVDRDTGEVTPLHVTAVAEIGRAIHPQMAAGQIEGGTLQGLGYALIEEVVMRDGRMANAQLTNYVIPTVLDTPTFDVAILERPYAHGPFGAKGVGEMPIDSPAPAVVNALRHAGYDLRAIPATPERVLDAPPAGPGAADMRVRRAS